MEQLVRVIQAATQEPLRNGDNVADSLISGARCSDGAARDDTKGMKGKMGRYGMQRPPRDQKEKRDLEPDGPKGHTGREINNFFFSTVDI